MQQEQQPINWQRVAVQLQQRLAETVANYEGQLAVLTAQQQEQGEPDVAATQED
jgi:hypothetical protein